MELKYFNFYLFPLFRFFENPSKDEVIIYNQCASLRVAFNNISNQVKVTCNYNIPW